MTARWGRHYCFIGPYNPQASPAEFEPSPPAGPFGRAVKALRAAGHSVHFGHWLIPSHPHVVLLEISEAMPRLSEIKYSLWEREGISFLSSTELVDRVLAFGHLVEAFLRELCREATWEAPVIAHFHEWMSASAIPSLRRSGLPLALVFTTHATLLGRFLAMSNPAYSEAIPHTDWREEARRVNLEIETGLERAATRHAHVTTTVSDVTAFECEHLLGRRTDIVTPNGLNIERFVVLHEFHNLHRQYKEKIHDFTIGHFFPRYTFDLDRTLYLVTSGRYEYTNKGFDLTLEAMARLNWLLKQTPLNKTLILFIVTRAPWHAVNPEVLRLRALLEEIRRDCAAIEKQVGERLFRAVAYGRWPHLDELVDEYWRIRLRRNLHAWKQPGWPPVVTHDLTHEADDAILGQIRRCQLFNRPEDPVKIIYHPDFISPTQPLFQMDYDQFVRGCHMGIFPSLYEPWGYAPMECVILGLPTVTSDLAGFGAYVMRHIPDHEERGIHVLRRRGVSFDQTADDLARTVFRFATQERRERIAQRNRVEACAELFDWSHLVGAYHQAHDLALERMRAAAPLPSPA